MNDCVKEIIYIYIYIYIYVYTCNEILLCHEKEGNSSIWDNMDGSLGHAKWNESDRERQRLCDIISIKT